MKTAHVDGMIAEQYGPNHLPVLASTNVPKPSGQAGNLTILDWAGTKAAASYTFDDSQPSQMQHYDQLHATGIHMTFYAAFGWNGTPGYDALWSRAVKDGNEIGNHTSHHPYANLTGAAAGTPFSTPMEEIDKDTQYIEQHFGEKHVWTFAAPYGDPGWAQYAKKRFFLDRGVQSGSIAPNGGADPFDLPAMMATGGQNASVFNADLNNARDAGNWVIFLFHSILPTDQNWYAGENVKDITGTIDHAKSLKDVWIDTMTNVGAYWVGEQTVEHAIKTTSGDTTTWKWTLPPNFPTGHYLRVRVDGGTLSQNGQDIAWDPHGYYEISLDAGSLTLKP